MNQLSHVLEYFPTGTAEGDRKILDRVFVYVDEFSQVIAPPQGSPHLLVGMKGCGKTAVLDFSRRMLEAQNVPNVLLTPFDIDTSSLKPDSSTGDISRELHATLLLSIVGKLSLEDSGILEKNYSILYHESIRKGIRSGDVITRGTRFLSEIAKPLIKIDINSAFPHLVKSTQEEVQEAVKKIVGRRGFYLFIDDTDQIASPGARGHLNRVWALLLAVRRLANDIPNLNAVVSLRSEVWYRLQRDDLGQRDQTDHFRRLVIMMKSDREHVGRIVDRRLSLAAAAAKAPVDGWQQFFDGADARPPTSSDRRLWRDLIIVR